MYKIFFLFSVCTFFCLHTFSQQQGLKQLRYFMQSAPASAYAIQYGNNPKAGHYVNAGDAKIYYEVYGKGKPIVILHGGIFGSTYEMAQFIDSLSKKYKVIAVSTRGHGKSELGTEPITYEQKANDVMAVINAVTKDSVIVLGFSDPGPGPIKGPGVFIYKADDATATKWTKHTIDDGGMATEDLICGDLNGDGKLDIVAGGRASHNVKLYLQK